MNLNVAIMNRSQRHWHSFIINLSPEKVVNSQFSLCYTCLLCPSWYALFLSLSETNVYKLYFAFR